jgi:lipoyl-dependent peroxiredoxin subunit D
MNITTLKDSLQDYARDIKLNLSKVLTTDGAPGLTQQQIFGCALASAFSCKNNALVEAIMGEAVDILSETEIAGIKTAATMMGMNNLYYRFLHLVEDKDYEKMPANLRMQTLVNHGINKVNFELYSMAVSAINGCGMCMEAHAHAVVKEGLSKQGVHSAVRIASVVHATAAALAIG